jgi:hypothetical protein
MAQKRRKTSEGFFISAWTGLFGLVLALAVGAGAGFFLGSRFPVGLDPEVTDDVAIRPHATAGLDSPIPSEVYSFYDMLDTPSAAPREEAAEVLEPVAEPEPMVVDEPEVVVAVVEPEPEPVDNIPGQVEEVRVVERVVPAPAPAAEQERAQSRALAAVPSAYEPPIVEDEQVLASSRTVTRTVVRSRAAGRPVAQAAAPGAGSTSFVASRGMTRNLADSLTGDLRGAGLVADTQAASDGLFEVVVRLTGSDEDQSRQRSLAERINRAGE